MQVMSNKNLSNIVIIIERNILYPNKKDNACIKLLFNSTMETQGLLTLNTVLVSDFFFVIFDLEEHIFTKIHVELQDQ